MMNGKIQDAFNGQINAELYSAYLYLSMAGYFESQNLKGMAHWMRIQSQEELLHAMKFFDFMCECSGHVALTPVDGPKTEWRSALEAFTDSYEHERKVTKLIHDLVDLSLREKDHAANTFLQWFVTEQVEEEAAAQEIRDKLKLVGDNAVVLFMIDQELSKRLPPPAPTAA